MGVVLTFGGLYGGVNGEGVSSHHSGHEHFLVGPPTRSGPDVPDDPAIELMLDMQFLDANRPGMRKDGHV